VSQPSSLQALASSLENENIKSYSIVPSGKLGQSQTNTGGWHLVTGAMAHAITQQAETGALPETRKLDRMWTPCFMCSKKFNTKPNKENVMT